MYIKIYIMYFLWNISYLLYCITWCWSFRLPVPSQQRRNWTHQPRNLPGGWRRGRCVGGPAIHPQDKAQGRWLPSPGHPDPADGAAADYEGWVGGVWSAFLLIFPLNTHTRESISPVLPCNFPPSTLSFIYCEFYWFRPAAHTAGQSLNVQPLWSSVWVLLA